MNSFIVFLFSSSLVLLTRSKKVAFLPFEKCINKTATKFTIFALKQACKQSSSSFFLLITTSKPEVSQWIYFKSIFCEGVFCASIKVAEQCLHFFFFQFFLCYCSMKRKQKKFKWRKKKNWNYYTTIWINPKIECPASWNVYRV